MTKPTKRAARPKAQALMVSLTALTLLSAPLAHAQPQETIEKQLTKAECLKKPGYVWIESSKRCVKQPRGSYD